MADTFAVHFIRNHERDETVCGIFGASNLSESTQDVTCVACLRAELDETNEEFSELRSALQAAERERDAAKKEASDLGLCNTAVSAELHEAFIELDRLREALGK